MLTAQLIQQNQNYYHGIASSSYTAANINFAKATTLGLIDYLTRAGMTERARLLREKHFPN